MCGDDNDPPTYPRPPKTAAQPCKPAEADLPTLLAPLSPALVRPLKETSNGRRQMRKNKPCRSRPRLGSPVRDQPLPTKDVPLPALNQAR